MSRISSLELKEAIRPGLKLPRGHVQRRFEERPASDPCSATFEREAERILSGA